MYALVAQWIARWTSNPEAAGSSPAESVISFLAIAQLVERWTVDVNQLSIGRGFNSHSRDNSCSVMDIALDS